MRDSGLAGPTTVWPLPWHRQRTGQSIAGKATSPVSGSSPARATRAHRVEEHLACQHKKSERRIGEQHRGHELRHRLLWMAMCGPLPLKLSALSPTQVPRFRAGRPHDACPSPKKHGRGDEGMLAPRCRFKRARLPAWLPIACQRSHFQKVGSGLPNWRCVYSPAFLMNRQSKQADNPAQARRHELVRRPVTQGQDGQGMRAFMTTQFPPSGHSFL